MELDCPQAFRHKVVVQPDDIDALNHANNVSYLHWLEDAAWAHSVALGVDMEVFRSLDRAMVARRHTLEDIAPCFENDSLIVATWIASNDQRLSMERRYQIVRESDGLTVLRGSTQWVCVALGSGKPKRMPPLYREAYVVTGSK
jgi:acyl-CoA thioester hydrolase